MSVRFEWTVTGVVGVRLARQGDRLEDGNRVTGDVALVLATMDGYGLVVEGPAFEVRTFAERVALAANPPVPGLVEVRMSADAARAVLARCEVAEENPFEDDADDVRAGMLALRAVLPEVAEVAPCGCVAYTDGTGAPCPEHHPDRRDDDEEVV